MEGAIGVSGAMLVSAFCPPSWVLAAVFRPGPTLAELVFAHKGGLCWGLGETGWAPQTEGR